MAFKKQSPKAGESIAGGSEVPTRGGDMAVKPGNEGNRNIQLLNYNDQRALVATDVTVKLAIGEGNVLTTTVGC